MLQRKLEPELMDTARDAIEYDAMDFSEANGKFATDALALLDKRPHPEVLDIGTGTAQIPLLMLARNPALKILAVDLAGEMIRLGIEKVIKAGFAAQCRLEKQDAKALRAPSRNYDLVLCNSTAHHIPNPVEMFREIARVVKPDGAIIIRDLIRPLSEADAWAIVKRAAAGEHARQQQLFFDSLCAALSLAEVEAMLAEAGLNGLRVARISDRHWTAERRAGSASGR